MAIYEIFVDGKSAGTVHEHCTRDALFAAYNLVDFGETSECISVKKQDDPLTPEMQVIVSKYEAWLNDWNTPTDTKIGVALLEEANTHGYSLEYKKMTYDTHGCEVPGHVKARKIR